MHEQHVNICLFFPTLCFDGGTCGVKRQFEWKVEMWNLLPMFEFKRNVHRANIPNLVLEIT